MPRIAKKQVNRDNAKADNPKMYYRRVFAILFIDKLISELELTFIKLSDSASRLFFLYQLILPKYHWTKMYTNKIIESYGKDLPKQDVVGIELSS